MFPRPDRTRSIHTADGGVILDINSGKMFSLNGSASAILELLEWALNDDQIVDELVRRFAISTELARTDLAEFRKSLETHSLSVPGPQRSKE